MQMNTLQEQFPEATKIDGTKHTSEEVISQLKKTIETHESNITILKLPPKGSANDKEVAIWNQVMLTKEWQQKAKDANIPYETEWFMISKINYNVEKKPISYNLSGSMGGGWQNMDWNLPNVIDYKC